MCLKHIFSKLLGARATWAEGESGPEEAWAKEETFGKSGGKGLQTIFGDTESLLSIDNRSILMYNDR